MHFIYNSKKDDSVSVASESIGDIKQTTLPFESSKWHLADASWVTGKIYSYVLRCEELYPGIFTCTNEEYEETLRTYGQCGKYVIDSENQRIRLPKLDGFIEGTSNIQQLSTLKPAGLPNITGNLYADRHTNGNCLVWGSDGAFMHVNFQPSGTIGTHATGGRSDAYTIPRLDASRSSPVYGRSQKVQPQAVIVLTYIKIQ